MSALPSRELLLTRPVDQPDVVIWVDGAAVDAVDMPIARAFLGDWKVRAKRVERAPIPAYVADDAILLELNSQERDDEGRLVAIVVWLASSNAGTAALDRAESFARPFGRSFDMVVAREALTAALAFRDEVRKRGGTGFFARVRRFLEGLGAIARKLLGGRK